MGGFSLRTHGFVSCHECRRLEGEQSKSVWQHARSESQPPAFTLLLYFRKRGKGITPWASLDIIAPDRLLALCDSHEPVETREKLML